MAVRAGSSDDRAMPDGEITCDIRTLFEAGGVVGLLASAVNTVIRTLPLRPFVLQHRALQHCTGGAMNTRRSSGTAHAVGVLLRGCRLSCLNSDKH